MIIVEGPDGAGKSTLVKKLCKELGLKVGERGVGDRDLLYKSTRQDTYTALSEAVGSHEPVKVWDRLFFSEFVYCQVVGRECEFARPEEEFIRRVLDALECPMIFCMPPFDVVEANVHKEKQMKGVRKGIEETYQKYENIAEQMVIAPKPFGMLYDYTGTLPGGMELGPMIENCRGYIERREKRSW